MSETEAYKDEDTLRELYIDEGLSQSQIAYKLDCEVHNVAHWMDKHNILTGKHSEGYTRFGEQP